MQILKMILKQKLLWIFVSVFSMAFNPAMAKSDKQIMGDVQKAREMSRKDVDHSKHDMPVDESKKFRGVFYGYLPCEDCDGIKTTLSLKNKNNYLLVTQYAKTSTREYFEKGKYTWDDKKRTVILTSRKKGLVRKYHIKDEGTLVLLSTDGAKVLASKDKYTLQRNDKKKSREVHIH